MVVRSSFLAASVVAATFFASGCGRTEPSAAQFQRSFAEVTEAECAEVCGRVERALAKGEAASLADVVDYDGFTRIVLDLSGLRGGAREAMRTQYAATGPADFEHIELLEALQRGIHDEVTRLDRLAIQRRSDRFVAVYRLLSSDGANYVELIFRRAEDGRVKVVDASLLWAGCRLSEAGIGIAEEASRRWPDLTDEMESRWASDEEMFYRTLDEAPTIERLDEAVARIDPRLRRSKFVILEQLDAATEEGERELQLLDRLVEAYPDEPFAALRSFAVYYRVGRHEEGLAQLERLDRAVGGDPSLERSRASLLLALGRVEEAKRHARAAIDFDKTHVTPYLTLISAYTRQGRREEALDWVETLADLDDVSPLDLLDLFGNDDFTALAASEEWRDRFDRSAKPLTERERTELAARIESAIVEDDAEAREHLLDVEGASRRIVNLIDVSIAERVRRRRLVKQILETQSILDAVARQQERPLAAGGSYRLLRVHERDGHAIAVYRAIDGDGRLRYFEFELNRAPDGSPRVVDVFNYSVGETSAEGMARAVRMGFDLTEGAEGWDESTVHPVVVAYERALVASVDGDEEGFQRASAELPEAIQQENVFLFASAFAALNDLEEFARRVALVEAERPHHPTTDFLRLQLYDRQERWEEALAAVDAIEKRVGSDPYLNFLRATYLLNLDRDAEARDWAIAAADAEPTLPFPRFALLRLAVREGDHAEAMAHVERLVGITGKEPRALLDAVSADDPEAWSTFSASSEWSGFPATEPESR